MFMAPIFARENQDNWIYGWMTPRSLTGWHSGSDLPLYTWEPWLWLLFYRASWAWPRTNRQQTLRLKIIVVQFCPLFIIFFFWAGVNIQDPHPSGLGSSSVSSVCLASMRTWVSFPKLNPGVGLWSQCCGGGDRQTPEITAVSLAYQGNSTFVRDHLKEMWMMLN